MKKFFGYSKDRPFLLNLFLCIFSFIGLMLIPSIIFILLNLVCKYEAFNEIVSSIIFLAILYLMYYKDLNSEFDIYRKDFKNKFKESFRVYIIGFMGMIFFNVIIAMFLGKVSSNESQVRELLFNNVALTMFSIAIYAPISEELIFRKSLRPLINNKWIYVIVSGLLFGGAHILTNVIQNTFVISDLIYVLPYACLGGCFALMDYDSKTVFSSMVIHALHNTCTGLLLLAFYFGGLL